MQKEPVDCLIIGGGPAGLTAAIYLARFHLKVRLVDAGESRAQSIPCTHNHAGFPNGIAGSDLLLRMKQQAVHFGTSIEHGHVTRLDRIDSRFEAEWGQGAFAARTVLLATGVRNRRPSIDERLHDQALADGLLRYCPICDGYEVTDKNVAVIGTGERGTNEAVFLRSFTADISLLAPDSDHRLNGVQRSLLAKMGIGTIDGPSHVLRVEEEKIIIETASGEMDFDTVYPALGSDSNSTLAKAVGAVTSEAGCIEVDGHQRTSVPGLYAAGDVVVGLDQISHAMGEGGVAATTIRNDLAALSPLMR